MGKRDGADATIGSARQSFVDYLCRSQDIERLASILQFSRSRLGSVFETRANQHCRGPVTPRSRYSADAGLLRIPIALS